MMTNQNSKSVVNVTMKVRLSDMQGQTIAAEDVTLWRAINRMPKIVPSQDSATR